MRRGLLVSVAVLLAGCVSNAPRAPLPATDRSAIPMDDGVRGTVRVTRHDGDDDLLTAGLGLAGLRGPAPGVLEAERPTPEELRRRAIWTSWRGIADLAPGGGFDAVYGSMPRVPGREYHAFAWVPGARQPHRVLAQVPDDFDAAGKRCLVVAAVSGSRGVYGTIAFAGGWALPRGCAVVYTDKGAGSDLFDFDSGTGVALDGTRATQGALAFAPTGLNPGPHRVGYRHAHSQDNPEADWGRHVVQAAAFGLRALGEAFPAQAPFDAGNTRIVVVGLSNGGGAALRAAELPEAANFAGVVAAAPQIVAPEAPPLFDYATLAALYQPCALAASRFDDAPTPVPRAQLLAMGQARCASLAAAGLLRATTPAARAEEAYELLRALGFTDRALRAGTLDVAFDLWRAVAVTYAAAYARATPQEDVCGFSFAALDARGQPRATTVAERALWWSDNGGIAPSPPVGIVDSLAGGDDPALSGLRRLRDAWQGDDDFARRVRAGIEETRASAQVHAPAVLVVHGIDDGLIPLSFTARPWVDAVRRRAPEAPVRLFEIENAQHFDAFLALPGYGSSFVPLMPYAWAAMDAVLAHAVGGAPLPDDAVIATRPRGVGESLSRANLGEIERIAVGEPVLR